MTANLLDRLCDGYGLEAQAPSVVIFAAHPDDEVIGAGSRLRYWCEGLTIVHVTDGAPRNLVDAHHAGFETWQDYACERHEESLSALQYACIRPHQVLQLNYADQEVSLHLDELRSDIRNVLQDLRPEVIITHPYEGGHPDHDATAFAVHESSRQLRLETGATPLLVEMTSYHNNHESISVCEFLPARNCDEKFLVLSEQDRQLKRRMFDCFHTQQRMLEHFPVAFERLRPAPEYDFLEPPHEGRLYYEMFDWGMTGAEWRALAQTALDCTATSRTR